MKNEIIDKLSFRQKGKIAVHMKDGRIIILSLKNFPSLKKLSPSERKNYAVITVNDTPDRIIAFNQDILFETKDFIEGKEIFA